MKMADLMKRKKR